MLAEARSLIDALPAEEVGRCVLDAQGRLFRGDRRQLEAALAAKALVFHRGSIRGSIPRFIDR